VSKNVKNSPSARRNLVFLVIGYIGYKNLEFYADFKNPKLP
jgi:hypothetical protein